MIGKTVSHYKIVSALGRGGMGVVYRAEDIRLGRMVALKFVPEGLAHDRAALERFRREARAVSTLNHPNICTLHDIDESEEGPFLVMECLEGQTLKDRIAAGTMPLNEVVDLAAQSVDALEVAHSRSIVHRDIKPANIFVTARAQIKMLDFGLAKMLAGAGDAVYDSKHATAAIDQLLTSPGSTIGTVAYMSPEQARGEELDSRSDLFSFGVVLYEMVTGRLPFDANSQALIYVAILQNQPLPVSQFRPEISPELDRIIAKALEKHRDLRYQSASDFRADLKRLQRDSGNSRVSESRPMPSAVVASAGPAIVERPPYGTQQAGASIVERPPFGTQPAGAALVERPPSGAQPAAAAASSVLPATASTPKPRRLQATLAALAAALLLVAAGVWYFLLRAKPLDSLAVLPFVNVGADPSTEYLSDGVTESLINNLSQLPKLSVRSFSAVAHYKNKDVNPQTAGSELKVRALLTGRLVRRGGDFVISAELVDVDGNRQIWGSQYIRKVDDMLAMQEEISREISEKLRLQLNGEDKHRLQRHETVDPAAYQLYLQGRYQWNKQTLDGLQQSIDYFQQAIQKDSKYAQAFAGEADAYALLADFNVLPAREVLPKVRSAAQQALSLDNALAEAHTSLAWAQFHDLAWNNAEKEFQRAIELNPSYPAAHSWYGELQMARGRFDQAREEMTSAYKLDALSPVLNLALASRSYYARDNAQAIEQCQKVLAMDSTFIPAHVCLARAYQQKPAMPEAIGEYRKALEISEGDTNELAALAQAFAVSHQESEARKILDQLKERSQQTYVQPMWMAVIHIGLGEKDQAFDWMQKAYDDRSVWLVYLKIDPLFDPIRNDERFSELLRRVGLATSN